MKQRPFLNNEVANRCSATHVNDFLAPVGARKLPTHITLLPSTALSLLCWFVRLDVFWGGRSGGQSFCAVRDHCGNQILRFYDRLLRAFDLENLTLLRGIVTTFARGDDVARRGGDGRAGLTHQALQDHTFCADNVPDA